MNETEADRIAAAINVLRPDWPTASLRSLIGRPDLMRRPRRDVAVALTWVACESSTKTPARVLEAGPWWKAATVESGTGSPSAPKPHEACTTCGKHRDRCGCDQPSERRDRAPAPDMSPVRNQIQAARHALRGNETP